MERFNVFYVLQKRNTPWGTNWETIKKKYATYEEAEAARLRMETPALYRVAEAYYTIRYRAVVKGEVVKGMTIMTLLDLVRDYQRHLEIKEQLAEETTQNNKEIEALKEKIADQMVDDDCTQISYSGYSFSLVQKTIYQKRSNQELSEAGVDFLEVLREEGLGDIIVEKVDPRTLSSTIKAQVEENGGLSEALALIVKPYETIDIARRRQSARTGGKK